MTASARVRRERALDGFRSHRTLVVSRGPHERTDVPSDRFARFLPLAGVLAGLLLAGGLILTYSIPSSETSFDETFAWWQDNRGQHQISGLLLAPLVALMLVFFGAGLQRSLRSNDRDSGHGSVAFGGAILGAAGFALIGMLEGAAANAAHEGHREAVYALSQLHSYDWLTFNAAWAAVLLATGLGARRNGMLPSSACMGDHRSRGDTADADRVPRVAPHPAVAGRGGSIGCSGKQGRRPDRTSRRAGRRQGRRLHVIAPRAATQEAVRRISSPRHENIRS